MKNVIDNNYTSIKLVLYFIIYVLVLFGLFYYFSRKKHRISKFTNDNTTLQDWAKSGTVTQSSTFINDVEQDYPQNAIDGNENTYSATTWESNPWWQVTLSQNILIDNIVIVQRKNNNMWPLDIFTISITNSSGITTAQIENTGGPVLGQKTFPGINAIGNVVKITLHKAGLLNMAEFKVFGSIPGPGASSSSSASSGLPTVILLNNLAVATQSSNQSESMNAASASLNGNTSSTSITPNPWWLASFKQKTYIDNIVIAGINTPESWYGIHYLDENNNVIQNEGYNTPTLSVKVGLTVSAIKIYRNATIAIVLTNMQIFGYQIQAPVAPRPVITLSQDSLDERHIKYGDIVLLWAWNSNFLFAHDSTGSIVAGGPRATPDSIENDAADEYFTFENTASIAGLNGATTVIKSGDSIMVRTWNLLYFEILNGKLTLNSNKAQATVFIISNTNPTTNTNFISYGDSITLHSGNQYINIPSAGGLYSQTSFSTSVDAISTFIIYDRYGNGLDVNWARQGIATMSSTSSITTNTAISAINGSITDFTLSAYEASPWWQLTLPQDIFIEKFMMSNRQDAYQDRLSNFDIFFYDSNGIKVGSFYFLKSQSTYVIPVINITARSVKIMLRDTNYLSISSVKIYGLQTNLVKNTDWAKTGTITMSSDWTGSWDPTLKEYHGENAVDGNSDTFAMTQPELRPWWMVKLVKPINISKIVIVNRRDCCQERLSNFNVLLYDDNLALLKTIFKSESLPSYSFNGINTTARYVKIMLQGTDWLHLSEVNIFGEEPPAVNTSSLFKNVSMPLSINKTTMLIENNELPLLPNGSMSIVFNCIIGSKDKNMYIMNKNLMPLICIHENKLMVTLTTKNGSINILTNAEIRRNIEFSIALIVKSKICVGTGWDYITNSGKYYYVNNNTKEYYETEKANDGTPDSRIFPNNYTRLNTNIGNILLNNSNNVSYVKIYLNSMLLQTKVLQSLPVFNTEDIKLFTPGPTSDGNSSTNNSITNLTMYNYPITNISVKDYSSIDMGINLVAGLKSEDPLIFEPNKLPAFNVGNNLKYTISFWFKPINKAVTYYKFSDTSTIKKSMSISYNSTPNIILDNNINITNIKKLNIWYKYDETYEKNTISVYLNNVLVKKTNNVKYDLSSLGITLSGVIYGFNILNFAMQPQDIKANNSRHPEQDKIDTLSEIWKTDLKCPNVLDIDDINNKSLLYSNNITESLYELKAADKDYSLCYGVVAGNLIVKYEKKELEKDPNYAKIEEKNSELLTENKKLSNKLQNTKALLPNSEKVILVNNLLIVKQQLSNNSEYQSIIKSLKAIVNRGHLLTPIITSLNLLTSVDIETKSQVYTKFKNDVMKYVNLQKLSNKL